MKLVTVVGNRPQLVKAAPLSLALRDAGIDEVVVHTGQHWDDELSQVFIDELGLDEPRYRLDLRTADVARLSPAIRGVLEDERPDLMMVLGDTNSTLAGARAATEAGLRVAHVEAGLRSGDLEMPEERARIEEHPAIGARMLLARGAVFDLAAVVTYEHHMRPDGSGFPRLRVPRDMHYVSRIVAVCDVYDALRTPRPWRPAWLPRRALEFIEEGAGSMFDAGVARAFTAMIRRLEDRASPAPAA